MDIQRKCFEESNNVNPDWSFKFDEELQQYIALDSEMELQVDEFNEHWDTFRAGWQAAKAQAVPEWFDYTKQSPQMDGNYQIFIKGEQITAKWVSRFGFADPIEGDALRQELITHWAMQPQSPKAQEPAND